MIQVFLKTWQLTKRLGTDHTCSQRLKNKRNFFVLDSSKSNEVNYLAAPDQQGGIVEMHKFGDVGRIANRYTEDRWDAW